MSQNVYQFIDVNRVDPAKKPIKIRKIEPSKSAASLGSLCA